MQLRPILRILLVTARFDVCNPSAFMHHTIFSYIMMVLDLRLLQCVVDHNLRYTISFQVALNYLYLEIEYDLVRIKWVVFAKIESS